MLLFGCMLTCTTLHSFGKGTKRMKGEKPLIRHYLLKAGIQYGIGKPMNARYKNDLNTPLSYSNNFNFYLKLRLKKISVSGGIRVTSFAIKTTDLQQSTEDSYHKSDFDITSTMKGSTLNVVTPYVYVGYPMQYKHIEVEPFVRMGAGFLNYSLFNVNLRSTQSNVLDQSIFFDDAASQTFFNPSIGVHLSKKLFNFITLTGSLAYDAGNPDKSELLETTIQQNFSVIRKRNIYLQNSVNNANVMIGVELTPFNRIYSNEKKHARYYKKHSV